MIYRGNPQTFPQPDMTPQSFNSDPEEAMHYARARLFQRYDVAAARASLAFFEGWRPRHSALPWVEQLMGLFTVMETRGARGPIRDLVPLMEVKGLACGVYGTCLTLAGFHRTADEVLSRARRCFEPSAQVRAVLDTRQAEVALKLFRFPEAQRLADRGLAAMANDDGSLMPFCCRDSALLVRGTVLGSRYIYANAPLDVLVEAIRVADEVLLSPIEELSGLAANMLVVFSAFMCFEGLPTPGCPEVAIPSGQREGAYSRWSRALLACAKQRTLSQGAEVYFREARVLFTELDLVFDVIQVTIDLQFWLIVSGKTREAASESTLIRRYLHTVTDKTQRDAISLWLVEVEQRRLSAEVAEQVYCEVRRLGKPRNLRSLICRPA